MRPMQLDRKSMRKLKRDDTLSICVASAMPHRASRVATISCFTASSWQIWAKFSWLMRLRKRCWSGCSTCSAGTKSYEALLHKLSFFFFLLHFYAWSSKYMSLIIFSSPRPNIAVWYQNPYEQSRLGPGLSLESAGLSWTACVREGCDWQTAWPNSTSSHTAQQYWPWTVRGKSWETQMNKPHIRRVHFTERLMESFNHSWHFRPV